MHGFELSSVLMWLIGAVVLLAFSGIFVRWLRGRPSQHQEVPINGRHRESKKCEADIFKLANKLDGYLTVSDVVIHLGYSPSQAEDLLEKMTDGLRVRMEVNDNGLIVYEFAEVIDSPRRTTTHIDYDQMTNEKAKEEENDER